MGGAAEAEDGEGGVMMFVDDDGTECELTRYGFRAVGSTWNDRCPHGNGIWYERDGRKNYTKDERPYGYSPFFTYGSHKSIEGAECCYSDRYDLWGDEKLKAALAAAGLRGLGGGWNGPDAKKIDRFVKAYHGEQYNLVGIVEWCNASTGYPCWSIHFKDASKLGAAK
jgi:hypothetical protein